MHECKDIDGLAVEGLMYSEVQAGKSGCDRGEKFEIRWLPSADELTNIIIFRFKPREDEAEAAREWRAQCNRCSRIFQRPGSWLPSQRDYFLCVGSYGLSTGKRLYRWHQILFKLSE